MDAEFSAYMREVLALRIEVNRARMTTCSRATATARTSPNAWTDPASPGRSAASSAPWRNK